MLKPQKWMLIVLSNPPQFNFQDALRTLGFPQLLFGRKCGCVCTCAEVEVGMRLQPNEVTETVLDSTSLCTRGPAPHLENDPECPTSFGDCTLREYHTFGFMDQTATPKQTPHSTSNRSPPHTPTHTQTQTHRHTHTQVSTPNIRAPKPRQSPCRQSIPLHKHPLETHISGSTTPQSQSQAPKQETHQWHRSKQQINTSHSRCRRSISQTPARETRQRQQGKTNQFPCKRSIVQA